jgi:uncharacterized protein
VTPDSPAAGVPTRIAVNGIILAADPSGALWWPARRVLVLADLHLEKGSRFAQRGAFLPPYDTAVTLGHVERLVQRLSPATVIALGDSFDDRLARSRLGEADAGRLRRLTGTCDWIWIAGNHDPVPPADLGGRVEASLRLDGLTFRHAPEPESDVSGEICGHLHPKAAVVVRGGRIWRRCFATDGRRMVLPAFGAYTGGLDVLDEAIAALFRPNFCVLMLGPDRLYPFPASRLSPVRVGI